MPRAGRGDAGAAPAQKRRRLGLGAARAATAAQGDAPAPAGEPSAPVEISINATFSDPEVRRRLRDEFTTGKPYPHGTLRPFLGTEALQAIRADLEKVQAVEKETDLFRFFQTSDLAAVISGKGEQAKGTKQGKRARKAGTSAAGLASKAPALASLVKLFGSAEFRELCSEITGCGELDARVDLASQVYPRGGHLLCHDDVIGTRKISFIYYMTDPSEDWTPAEGGTLELYPPQEGAPPGTPATAPSKELLPLADSLAFFMVEPGVSFHAVREVRGERARISLQGWLHAPSLEKTMGFQNRGLATLQQLLETRPDIAPSVEALAPAADKEEGKPEAEDAAAFSAADAEALAPWLSPEYLKPEQVQAIAERFADDSYAVLTEFLRPDVAERVAAALAASDAADGFAPDAKEPDVPPYAAGASGGWEPVGPPHFRRYLRYSGAESAGTGSAQAASSSTKGVAEAEPHARLGAELHAVSEGLFRGMAFQRWLRACTRLEPRSAALPEIRRFRPGMDYTVAVRTGSMSPEEAALDATLVFAANDAAVPGATERWTGEEVGGFESYLAADEDDRETAETQETYRDLDSEGPLVNLPATANALCLVMRDRGTLRFVKYLSRDAPSSRVDVAASFVVDAPTGGDSSDEAGEEPQPDAAAAGSAPSQ